MKFSDPTSPILTPDIPQAEEFTSAEAAVARLIALYDAATDSLAGHFSDAVANGRLAAWYRAFYPEIRFTTTSLAKADSRLRFGHVTQPDTYSTTVTRPDLFRNYLEQQIELMMQSHGVPVTISASETPIPVHFQNHVLFTNYQFYIEEFEAYARAALADLASGYTAFVGPGNAEITTSDGVLPPHPNLP